MLHEYIASWKILPADMGVRLYLLVLEGKVVAKGAQKCFRNLQSSKILGDRSVTWSRFLTEYPQILGAIVQNLVTRDLYTPRLLYIRHSLILKKSLHFDHRVYLRVTYDSQNKQWLFRQTELTGWFLYWRLTAVGEVRTELFHVLKYCSHCLIQNIIFGCVLVYSTV